MDGQKHRANEDKSETLLSDQPVNVTEEDRSANTGGSISLSSHLKADAIFFPLGIQDTQKENNS